MRLIKTLALAAVTTGLSLALPALAHSGPRPHAPATAPAASAQAVQPTQPAEPTPHHPTPGRHPPWTWPLLPPPGAPRPTIVRRFEPPAQR